MPPFPGDTVNAVRERNARGSEPPRMTLAISPTARLVTSSITRGKPTRPPAYPSSLDPNAADSSRTSYADANPPLKIIPAILARGRRGKTGPGRETDAPYREHLGTSSVDRGHPGAPPRESTGTAPDAPRHAAGSPRAEPGHASTLKYYTEQGNSLGTSTLP